MGDVKNISVFDACAVVSILKNPDLVSDLQHCYSLTRGQLMHFRTNLPAIHTEMKQCPGQIACSWGRGIRHNQCPGRNHMFDSSLLTPVGLITHISKTLGRDFSEVAENQAGEPADLDARGHMPTLTEDVTPGTEIARDHHVHRRSIREDSPSSLTGLLALEALVLKSISNRLVQLQSRLVALPEEVFR